MCLCPKVGSVSGDLSSYNHIQFTLHTFCTQSHLQSELEQLLLRNTDVDKQNTDLMEENRSLKEENNRLKEDNQKLKQELAKWKQALAIIVDKKEDDSSATKTDPPHGAS